MAANTSYPELKNFHVREALVPDSKWVSSFGGVYSNRGLYSSLLHTYSSHFRSATCLPAVPIKPSWRSRSRLQLRGIKLRKLCRSLTSTPPTMSTLPVLLCTKATETIAKWSIRQSRHLSKCTESGVWFEKRHSWITQASPQNLYGLLAK